MVTGVKAEQLELGAAGSKSSLLTRNTGPGFTELKHAHTATHSKQLATQETYRTINVQLKKKDINKENKL